MDVGQRLEGTAVVELAREAIATGEWGRALELLRAAPPDSPLPPEALDLLGEAAYRGGDLEAALTAWELVHARHLRAGDRRTAARAAVRVAMYLMMDTGLMSPVRGWTGRAARLLEGDDESDVHAWLAMVRSYERLLSGDIRGARASAREAIEAGLRHDAPAPVAVGRVAAARIEILDGHVEHGLALLEEAAVATVSGELDALSVGMVYCELICAMQGLAQYDRAQQWTEAMERWRSGHAFGSMNGRCRVHRAEILRLRGRCEEAEGEALRACEELRPWMRREFGWPLTELGTIRLRKGDLPGAEESFLAAHEHGWDPQPGLALLRLAQGDPATASALIHDALAHPSNVPSKERPPYGELPRAPLLEAQVEIALALHDLDAATQAAGELASIAERFRSAALHAMASLACGRVAVAGGNAAVAVPACEAAVHWWSELDAPYEASVARLALAAACRLARNEERSRLETAAARTTFRRIGAMHPGEPAGMDDGGELARSPGGVPIDPSTTNLFRRDGDTRLLQFAGRNVLLRDLKGMRYLARLLAEPSREFHVLDLVTAERGSFPTRRALVDGEVPGRGESDGGSVLDDRAKQAYRRRLAEIDEDLDDAALAGDTERVALAKADRDYLVTELSRAFGLGGRSRGFGSNAERARSSVTRAIRYASSRIRVHHPELAEHLDYAVHTGVYCAYTPDPRAPISWST